MAYSRAYLSSNRGIIKIAQIIMGFVICSVLCANWYGGRSCFGEGRLGYCSGLNFVMLVINIVLFLLNFLTVGIWRLERVYSSVGSVLFLIASVLIIWFIIEYGTSNTWLIVSAVLIVVQTLMYIWDTQILSGEKPNYSGPIV